jgi:glycosyltransferase involved in cell wall biosynthesis
MSLKRNKPKITLFMANLGGGGAERVMVNLAQGLVDLGYPVDFVLASATGPYVPLLPRKVRVIDLHKKRVLTSLPALVGYLRREKPAAIISGLDHANLIALWAGHPLRVLARSKTQVMVTVNIDYGAFWQGKPPLKDRIILDLVRRFYPWADVIVAASTGAAESMTRVGGVKKTRIQTIYNPVVTPELFAKVAAPLEHDWFGQNQPPVILGVGRLLPVKDFPTLIRAFARLREERSIRLMILGEGEERATLEALIAELRLQDDVLLPGFVDNPYAVMARAGVFALSSRSEALPTVLIEAMACGCPVVSTDCPSGPAEILQNGKYGALVPVGDDAALAAALRNALDSAPDKTQLQARVDDFSLEKITHAYLAALGLQ